jgi:hypothetical protein
MIHRRGNCRPGFCRGLLENHFSKCIRAAKEFCTVEFDDAFQKCREFFLKSRFFCNPLQIVCILDSVARHNFPHLLCLARNPLDCCLRITNNGHDRFVREDK